MSPTIPATTSRWALTCLFLSFAIIPLAGCPKDPFDAETWIDKLDDPSEAERAVTELQRLKDPAAIGPLSAVWRKKNKSQRVLRVIIEIAAKPAKGEPQWGKAMPVLLEAIDDFDEADDRSVDNAVIAADAIGRSGDVTAVEGLVKVVNKNMVGLSKGQRVRLAAIKALGNFGGDGRAVDTLIKVLDEVETMQTKMADAKNDKKELQRVQREFGGKLPIFGATINALAESRSPKALPALLSALYTLSPLYQQVRRGLVSIGSPAVPELIKIIRGENPQMNAMAKKFKFNIDCSAENMGPDTTCTAPTNLEFKAASMLGDLYAREAAKDLAAGLKKPAWPAFFEADVPGPSQHAAFIDALKKIGDPATAAAMSEYWQNDKVDPFLYPRPLAVDAYSFLTRDTSGLAAMAKVFTTDGQDDQLRLATALSYGRLVNDTKQLEPLDAMVKRYKDAADKQDEKAKPAKVKLDAAQKILDDAKKALATAGGKTAPPAAKEAAQKAQEAYDKLEETLGPEVQKAAGYRDFQRTFEQHIARAEVGIRCKDDANCYAAELEKTPEQKGFDLTKYIAQEKWTKEEKEALLPDLRTGAIERAVIELSKMGDKATGVTEKLLKHAASTDRLVRQGVLLALVHSAKLPCEQCVTALDAVMAAAEGQSTLQQLTAETEVVREYFVAANKRGARAEK
jgi:hypothetical protein